MRLPGFPRKRKDGSWGEVGLLWYDDSAVYELNDVVKAINGAWSHPYAFSPDRWAKFKGACAKRARGESIAPMTVPSDAFRLDEAKLFPKTTTYSDRSDSGQSNSENPWVQWLQEDLLPTLHRLPLEQQFNEFDHQFTSKGGELVGRSPFSTTNSSGSSFHVEEQTGEWFCWASVGDKKGRILQYLQELWFGNTHLRGQDFIEFCKRLADKVNVPMPEGLQQKYESQRQRQRTNPFQKTTSKPLLIDFDKKGNPVLTPASNVAQHPF